MNAHSLLDNSGTEGLNKVYTMTASSGNRERPVESK